MSFFLKNPDLFSVFKMENLSIYGSLIFFGILYAPVDIFTRFLFNYLSRKHEFEADKFSAKTTKKPMHLISSLKKLTLQNLSNLNPHWLNVWLNYTHPPVLQRINLLKKQRISLISYMAEPPTTSSISCVIAACLALL